MNGEVLNWMARKKKEEVVAEPSNELCPNCERIILESGRKDSIEDLIKNGTQIEFATALGLLKEGHTVRRVSTGREYVLRVNPYDANKAQGLATVDENDNVTAFWTLTPDELLADDWIVVK
jgi:hypothetical protein